MIIHSLTEVEQLRHRLHKNDLIISKDQNTKQNEKRSNTLRGEDRSERTGWLQESLPAETSGSEGTPWYYDWLERWMDRPTTMEKPSE